MLLDITRSVYSKIKDIEDLKALRAKEEEEKKQSQSHNTSGMNNLSINAGETGSNF